MGRFILTEDEKKDILSKYVDDTDSKIFTYLRRNYPVTKIDHEYFNGFHHVLVDDKTHIVERNKKYLVGKIYHDMSDNFPSYDEKVIRRTIKKFLDLIIAD